MIAKASAEADGLTNETVLKLMIEFQSVKVSDSEQDKEELGRLRDLLRNMPPMDVKTELGQATLGEAFRRLDGIATYLEEQVNKFVV